MAGKLFSLFNKRSHSCSSQTCPPFYFVTAAFMFSGDLLVYVFTSILSSFSKCFKFFIQFHLVSLIKLTTICYLCSCSIQYNLMKARISTRDSQSLSLAILRNCTRQSKPHILEAFSFTDLKFAFSFKVMIFLHKPHFTFLHCSLHSYVNKHHYYKCL